MLSRFAISLAFVSLAACDSYPRDMDGTLDSIRANKLVRVGLVAAGEDNADRSAALAYVTRVASAAGAHAAVREGAAEPLLSQLETGELDLVIGDFAEDSPWMTHVAPIEPLRQHRVGERRIGLHPVARNGENAWIALLERTARDMGAKS